MERNIKDNKNNNSMTKSIISILLLVFLVSSVSAIDREILHWDFEEGGGVLALDSSGNNNNGLIDKPQYSTTSKFGVYSQYFDRDFISGLTTINSQNNITVSFWIKQRDQSLKSAYFELSNGDESHELYFDENNQELRFSYVDINLINRDILISNIDLAKDSYKHIIYTLNTNTSQLIVYVDKVEIYNQILTNKFHKSITPLTLVVADDKENNHENYRGNIDSFRIFNFIVNTTQINELFTSNTITIPINTPDVVLNGTTQTPQGSIINSITPINNSTNYNPTKITTTLNHIATCNLYFENDLVATFENILSFNYELPILDSGNYSYFVYCEYIDSNLVKQFEISNTTTFSIDKNPPNVITFNVIGSNFNTNDYELYITTPCMNEGFSAIGTDYKPYNPKYNTGGILFSKVDNGYSSIIVNGDKNEYCLYNGRIIINDNGTTTNYDAVDILGVVELGNIQTPNNVTDTYIIKLEQFDIFNKTNPKAWGETWRTIIGGIILLVIGIIITIFGVTLNNGKITIAGVFLILSSLGISLSGFVGLIV